MSVFVFLASWLALIIFMAGAGMVSTKKATVIFLAGAGIVLLMGTAYAQTARSAGATGACAHELLAYCPDVVIGQGRQRVCLREHVSQASPQCRAKIAEWFPQ